MKQALFLTAFLCALPVSAVIIPVVNHSFEDVAGESSFNEFTFGPLNGWDLHDPGGITSGGDGPTYYIGTLAPQPVGQDGNPEVYEFFPDGAPDGNRVGIAFNFSGSGNTNEYGFVQTLSETVAVNTQYNLRVLVGNIASGDDLGGNFYNLNGFPGYRIELLAIDTGANNPLGSATVLAVDNNSLAGSLAEGTFQESSIVYTATEGAPSLGLNLGIRLVNLNIVDQNATNADLEVDFDNVRLDATAVPEPAQASLLLATLLLTWTAAQRGRVRSHAANSG